MYVGILESQFCLLNFMLNKFTASSSHLLCLLFSKHETVGSLSSGFCGLLPGAIVEYGTGVVLVDVELMVVVVG